VGDEFCQTLLIPNCIALTLRSASSCRLYRPLTFPPPFTHPLFTHYSPPPAQPVLPCRTMSLSVLAMRMRPLAHLRPAVIGGGDPRQDAPLIGLKSTLVFDLGILWTVRRRWSSRIASHSAAGAASVFLSVDGLPTDSMSSSPPTSLISTTHWPTLPSVKTRSAVKTPQQDCWPE